MMNVKYGNFIALVPKNFDWCLPYKVHGLSSPLVVQSYTLHRMADFWQKKLQLVSMTFQVATAHWEPVLYRDTK